MFPRYLDPDVGTLLAEEFDDTKFAYRYKALNAAIASMVTSATVTFLGVFWFCLCKSKHNKHLNTVKEYCFIWMRQSFLKIIDLCWIVKKVRQMYQFMLVGQKIRDTLMCGFR